MTIPFLDLFKKLIERFAHTADEPVAPAVPARALRKPTSERLSKTVLPHATRSFSAPDPFRSATSPTSVRTATAPLQLGSQRITAAPKRPQTSHLPPALARALEPKLERTISLQIADFIDCVPAGYIKPVEILDPAARVSLKASEIEKGMPEKNPTIALPSLYQQVPEIFLKGVRPDDDTRVALPYDKVLLQFQGAQVRADQLRDPAVPQVDTPILKATIQDSERFGTKIEPIETTPLPSVPVSAATTGTIAPAEAEPVVQATKKSTASGQPIISLYSPGLKPKSEPPAPAKNPSRGDSIPFDLSPNGTGASASERVPASSGPPVPTPLPFSPELAKIAFQQPAEKTKAPETKKPSESTVATPVLKSAGTSPTKAGSKLSPPLTNHETLIRLSLKTVLKNLPAFQFNGDSTTVADDAQVALPLSLIEPQLASGRISIAPDVFQKALPEKYREMFEIDEAKASVTLPLEEVLKNLPATILKLRDDQESLALDKDFETPFSVKAKEDADRFATAKAPAVETAGQPTEEPLLEAKIETAPVAEEKLDPKRIVADASALPGVKTCAITFSDGLSLAGELPEEIVAEGLCAVAPSILERVAEHVRATKLGSLVAVTLYTSSSSVSFFAHGNICLTAVHAGSSLSPETRARIAELVEKLSNTYTQREKRNVDH